MPATMALTKPNSSNKKRICNDTIVTFKRWLLLRPMRSLLIVMIFVASLVYHHPTVRSNISNKFLRTDTSSVPSCTSSPWKEGESLHGNCQGSALKLNPKPQSAKECATTCCDDPTCITFQYRSDVGCFQGEDDRLGMEKDGGPTWCNQDPPGIWRGE